jgi:DNA-binding MarR family transcriptional regulator
VFAHRVDRIEAIYFATHSVEETARAAREELGVSRSTVCRVLKALREKWARESTTDREERRAELRRGLARDLAEARSAKRWTAVVAIARLVAELDALLIERSEVVTARSPLDGLSLAELRYVRDHGRLPGPGEVIDAPALPAPSKADGR